MVRYLPACLAIAGVLFSAAPVFAENLIPGGTFDHGAGTFWASGKASLAPEQGKLCAKVAPGGQPWDSLVGVNGLVLVPGATYRLSMAVDSSAALVFPVLVQRDAEPWTPQANFDASAGKAARDVTFQFRATEADPAQIIFQLGGASRAFKICFDDVTLGAIETPKDDGATMPAFVNQSGYFLNGPKRATILSGSPEPIAFQLVDASGAVVGKGTTEVTGFDPSVGRNTHVADFSAFSTPGAGYRVLSNGEKSYPFSIGHDVYGKLRIDALSWFYPQRSGIAIDGAIGGQAYARPAGHIGQSPNQGDTDVPCLEGPVARTLYGDSWSCDYRLDVSGGWYDAGDQGKYVVNGAIAVAQLMGAFERGLTFGKGASPVMSDSLSRIPENGNGVPDILDEARWELEFLMKMMVPDGQPLAGMLHHKVHDEKWTSVPMLPHLDPEPRVLHRPSTAATLDFAAAAAQGARLFAPYDADFSKTLLAAARKAWLAAAANPVLYAPRSDGLQGGGDYDDDDVSDEIYWAASELYLTTGKASYLAVLRSSRYWSGAVFSAADGFQWRNVAGLARLQLALYATGLPDKDREMIRDTVIKAGETFLALQKKEPFGHIYRPNNGKYGWGSNHLILQNMIVLSAAYDLTGEAALLGGIRESMDYLLGRNAMNMSYITGYGSVFSQNQHSKWYAYQMDDSLPHPPPGSLAGGPNSDLVDDVAKARLSGCEPQACYVDDIMAWSSNEIAINWNAPLVYVASFLADVQ